MACDGADARRPGSTEAGRGVAHRLEPLQLALGLRTDLVRHACLVDLRAVLLEHRAFVLAELLADRVHLLAQEVLALLLLRAGLDVVFTWRGVVVAMAVMALPLLVRGARVAFEGVDPQLEEAARSSGASNRRVFFRVTLPLAARGIVGGSLLAFARAVGEFGATILVAGNLPGRTTTISPTSTSSTGMSRSAPSRTTRAVFAWRPISSLTAS